jgi:hypothetical protein
LKLCCPERILSTMFIALPIAHTATRRAVLGAHPHDRVVRRPG